MSKLFYLQPSSRVKYTVNTHIFLYSLFFLPLPFVAIIIVVVSIMFFWRPKERKAPAHGTYQSVVALFESCLWQHFSATSNLVTKVFSFAFWVLRNDRASEYNASLLANCKRAQPVVGEANLTHVQTVLALFPKSKRPFVVLLTVPDLLKNHFCYGFC